LVEIPRDEESRGRKSVCCGTKGLSAERSRYGSATAKVPSGCRGIRRVPEHLSEKPGLNCCRSKEAVPFRPVSETLFDTGLLRFGYRADIPRPILSAGRSRPAPAGGTAGSSVRRTAGQPMRRIQATPKGRIQPEKGTGRESRSERRGRGRPLLRYADGQRLPETKSDTRTEAETYRFCGMFSSNHQQKRMMPTEKTCLKRDCLSTDRQV